MDGFVIEIDIDGCWHDVFMVDDHPMTDPNGAAILMVCNGSHQYTPK